MDVTDLLLCMFLFCVAMSEFPCPKQLQTTGCTCTRTIWWNNDNRTIVNCSMANLKSIPNFGISEQYEITQLILSNNNISDLSTSDFTDIIVKEMDLSWNPISRIHTDLSPFPKHLHTLILRKSNLSVDTDMNIFRGLFNLTELILDFNALRNEEQVLPGKLFQELNLISLRKLSMQSCEIGEIHQNAFIGLEKLEELDLSYNYLEEVPGAVKVLSSLKKIILLGNNIMRLRSNSFNGLHSIVDLNLNVNEITYIDPDAFKGLENSVRDVRLHYNNLNTLPYEPLRKLKRLSFLVISRNNINSIPKNAFVGMSSLKILELDSNKLVFRSGMFAGLEHSLETLTLRDTGLTALPVTSLIPLRKLTDLDVSRNKISTLSRGDIGRLKLKTIDLSHNKVGYIQPDVFTGIGRTISLDLDNNKLSDISFVLNVTPCAFSYIDVSGNDIMCDCDTETIINSGIVVGVGPTGKCTLANDTSGHHYKLGASLLSRKLIERCNKTERVYDCQNMELYPDSGFTVGFSFIIIIFCVVLPHFLSWLL